MSTLLAGAAVIDITPPIGGLMDGYGGRTQGSHDVRGRLFGRALVLDDGTTKLALITTDLLGVHPEWVDRVRSRVTELTGIPRNNVLVSATHNHAGPAGLRGGMFARLDEQLADRLVRRLLSAFSAAYRNRRPAGLLVGNATVDTVSMNRRDPDGPTDPIMRVLLLDGERGPIATAINFACHATVLSGANLVLSSEFPGAACSFLSRHWMGPCLYLNGACGDVNPTWIRQDFESVERVGQIIGGQALRIIGELQTLGPGQRAHNIRWDEFPEKPVPGRIVEPSLKAVRREIDLPLRKFATDEDYAARIEQLRAKVEGLPDASKERRAVMAQLTRAENERWAAAWARRQPEKAAQRTQIQALRLGDGLAVLALPGEFFVETAASIREASGICDLLVACYANDYIGYVIPPHAYDEGGYESGITFCGPEAESIIVDASVELLREVMSGD
jgi:hypothetical protein